MNIQITKTNAHTAFASEQALSITFSSGCFTVTTAQTNATKIPDIKETLKTISTLFSIFYSFSIFKASTESVLNLFKSQQEIII